ncbi:MAG: lipoyl domain-containing protein [Candidatus Ratteibacteria bacterium]
MKRQMILPLTEEVDKGSISFWYASEGEEVESGKPLVEVITEKTSFTVESPWTGRLVKIYAEEGAEISKGEVVADIEETEIS